MVTASHSCKRTSHKPTMCNLCASTGDTVNNVTERHMVHSLMELLAQKEMNVKIHKYIIVAFDKHYEYYIGLSFISNIH